MNPRKKKKHRNDWSQRATGVRTDNQLDPEVSHHICLDAVFFFKKKRGFTGIEPSFR
jgi:hypothetical protein